MQRGLRDPWRLLALFEGVRRNGCWENTASKRLPLAPNPDLRHTFHERMLAKFLLPALPTRRVSRALPPRSVCPSGAPPHIGRDVYGVYLAGRWPGA